MKTRLKIMLPIVAMMLPIVFMASCKDDDDNIDDGLRPTIVSTDPLSNQTGVARNKIISITFSEAMSPNTINSSSFTLKQGNTQIEGIVEYSGETATFTSLSTFQAASMYTATMTTDAENLNGFSLKDDHEWVFTTGGSTSINDPVDLGSSVNYVILAKTAINNNGTSAITGDIGISPAATTYITGLSLTDFTGYATSDQVTGKVYAADMADPTPINLTTAVNNLNTAYEDAAGRSLVDFLELGTGNIGGKTLTAGTYKWTGAVTIPSDVTISGSSTDIWIFQIAGTLTLSADVSIILSGGAQAKNIYWQVADQVTLGTTSHFEGIILAKTGITLQTGASINGRLLAQTAVVLDGNAVTQPQ